MNCGFSKEKNCCRLPWKARRLWALGCGRGNILSTWHPRKSPEGGPSVLLVLSYFTKVLWKFRIRGTKGSEGAHHELPKGPPLSLCHHYLAGAEDGKKGGANRDFSVMESLFLVQFLESMLLLPSPFLSESSARLMSFLVPGCVWLIRFLITFLPH